MQWRGALATVLVGFVVSWQSVGKARAAETEIRLVAADRPERPPVSALVDIRRAPDGGLVATTWVSSVRLGDAPLFPVANLGKLAPAAPELAGGRGPILDDDTADLLEEIRRAGGKNKGPGVRPVDRVDPLYQDKTLSTGLRIGPLRTRRSVATIELERSQPLTPGDATVEPGRQRVEVACYGVTIVAVSAGPVPRSAAFVPQLTWRQRDLLADCLFEHSPDLPLGDVPDGATQSLQERLEATRGGRRAFRRLTIYLPASGTTPYVLNGHAFQLDSGGVHVANGASRGRGAQRSTLRASGKFALELVVPPGAQPDPSEQVMLPVLKDLAAGWSSDVGETLKIQRRRESLAVSLRAPDGSSYVLQPAMPAPEAEQDASSGAAAGSRPCFLVLTAGDDQPAAYVVSVPQAHETAGGQLAITLSAAGPAGPLRLDDACKGRLSLWPQSQGGQPRPLLAEDAAPVELNFQRDEGGRRMIARLAPNVEPGLYALSLEVGGRRLPAVPLVIADEQSASSVSLLAYHNRCDYLRGERVDAAVITRAVAPPQDARATLWLQHEDDPPQPAGTLTLKAQPGQASSQFVALPTADLPIGRYVLTLKAPGAIVYPMHFTVYSQTPRSTFALYSWMPGSFSGPVRAAGQVLVNCLLDQPPTSFLSPDELPRYTDQQTVPAALRGLLAADALWPAPEKTDTYDPDTEREMAVAMRLGLRFAPGYGWGLNSQEASWNPKHTLAADIARVRRLCSQVTQRYRDFGNFAGLHLNWYPTFGGYWENHPPTDGHAGQRNEALARQVESLQLPGAQGTPQGAPLTPEQQRELARRRLKYRVGALARAYQAWTAQARQLPAGMVDKATPLPDVDQPGLAADRPVYTSFLPVSWFHQQQYYPSVYFSTLPVAGVHAYTDYGFSPLQHLWALDYWAAGVGNKPRWVTSMSNGRDILLTQALLAAGRGADGIDLDGDDSRAAAALAEFLRAYGPFFRALVPESDVAIVTSLTQQIVGGRLVDRWMGYTGGKYFDLYAKLWYARRPPDMLPEEEITLERLRRYKAVFLVGQQAPLPDAALKALREYEAGRGRIFKDEATSEDYPGTVYSLASAEESAGPKWDLDRYVATRDRMFVATQAGYEAVASSLDKLLGQLDPPHVTTPSHHTLVASLTGGQVAAVMAVNDMHPPPGIYHPWNFWSATIVPARSELIFDRRCVVYDLLPPDDDAFGAGPLEMKATSDGRYVLPVTFDRTAGRAFLLTRAPIAKVALTLPEATSGGLLPIAAGVVDAGGETIADPLPFEIALIDPQGNAVETIYRAVGPDSPAYLTIPAHSPPGTWRVAARELASGRMATGEIRKTANQSLTVEASPVLVPRPNEVQAFFERVESGSATGQAAKQSAQKGNVFDPLVVVEAKEKTEENEEAEVKAERKTDPPAIAPSSAGDRPYLVLLDKPQLAALGPKLVPLAEALARRLSEAGLPAEVAVVDPLELVGLPQRWQLNERDRHYLAEVERGERVAVAEPLVTRYFQGERQLNQPDWLHPASGYGEPGARHRIARNAILLGSAATSRYIDDLHGTVGMRASENFPAAGSALVQVVFDAFVPEYNALSIQASDLAGLERGINAVMALVPQQVPKASSEAAASTSEKYRDKVWHGDEIPRLPRPGRALRGVDVYPMAFTSSGDLLASAGTQAANYFLIDSAGQVRKKWLGKYGLILSGKQQATWIHDWWGVPGLLGKTVCADANLTPRWMMEAPRFSGNFQGWSFPGRRQLADPVSDDLYLAGHRRLMRISPEGKVLWQYDDTATCHDVDSFRFARDVMLHGISPDGKYLLVALMGIEPYSHFVSRFVRPAAMLVEAETGRVVWEKPDILIDHSACGFTQGKIVLADATPGRKRVMLLDLEGSELWSLARPQGTGAAELTPDGHYLIAIGEAQRDANHRQIGPATGPESIRLTDGQTRPLPLTGALRGWRMAAGGRVLLATEDGWLRLLTPEAKVVWEKRFDGPVNFLATPDGDEIVVGSPSGHLQWLDAEGKVTRQLDLASYNMPTDLDAYVRDYTRTPGDIPLLQPTPGLPPAINEQKGVVQFSANLLGADKPLVADEPAVLSGPTSYRAKLKPGATCVLSLLQRAGEGHGNAAAGPIVVQVRRATEKEPFYRAELPLSATWEERTLGWRIPSGVSNSDANEFEITIRPAEPKSDAPTAERAPVPQARRLGLFQIELPSRNLFAQRVPDAPDDPLARGERTGKGSLFDTSEAVQPPTLRYFMPNDVSLTERARGAPPFQRVMPYTVPFDGRLAGQETSWLAKPLSGSTHALLEMKFAHPATLAALAVFEDTAAAARYTDTYALLLHDATRKRWVQAGSVIGNRSPFHLFQFEPTEVDAVVYLWLSSGDGHARIAELEAYAPQRDLVP